MKIKIEVGDEFIEITAGDRMLAISYVTADSADALKEAFENKDFWEVFIDSVKGSIIED